MFSQWWLRRVWFTYRSRWTIPPAGFLLGLLWHWRRMWYVPLKCWTLSKLHGIRIQKTLLFTITTDLELIFNKERFMLHSGSSVYKTLTFCSGFAEQAMETSSTINELHVWTHVCFAPVASNRPNFSQVHNGWHIFLTNSSCQRTHYNTKWHSSLEIKKSWKITFI